jgi:hypothetical protein
MKLNYRKITPFGVAFWYTISPKKENDYLNLKYGKNPTNNRVFTESILFKYLYF